MSQNTSPETGRCRMVFGLCYEAILNCTIYGLMKVFEMAKLEIAKQYPKPILYNLSLLLMCAFQQAI